MAARLYRYVGPQEIADAVRHQPLGVPVRSPADVAKWVTKTGQVLNAGLVTVTFVIDGEGELRIADRHSEHVACAGGMPVQSAGEMTFHIARDVEVVSVSNQSTGYCPEPSSWPSVASALVRAKLDAPPRFDREYLFRRCLACSGITLVKDGTFECGLCGVPLSVEYNVQ